MKALLMDGKAIDRALSRISHEIIERNKGTQNIVIVGIKTRGIYLGERIAQKINEIEQSNVKSYSIDITRYRDDIGSDLREIVMKKNEVENDLSEFSIQEMTVILVDDVLYTGRTVRSAMNALLEFGRPSSIQLAVLIDRGHRELPIRADYVGKNVPTSVEEKVKVSLTPHDEESLVAIY